MTTTITGATGVNQITDDAITAAKLPSGSVLQVGYVDSATITTVTNTTTDILTLSITRKHANSFFILKTQLFVGMATSNSSQDGADPSFGFQINNTRILQTVDSSHNDGGFYGTDVPAWHSSSTHSGWYEMYRYGGFCKASLSGSVGDTVEFSVTANAGSLGLKINGGGSSSGSKACSMLEVMEVAG